MRDEVDVYDEAFLRKEFTVKSSIVVFRLGLNTPLLLSFRFCLILLQLLPYLVYLFMTISAFLYLKLAFLLLENVPKKTIFWIWEAFYNQMKNTLDFGVDKLEKCLIFM